MTGRSAIGRSFDAISQILKRLHSHEEYPGNGIGLAVCRRIVTRHGGKIWVESQPDVGSRFFFTLTSSDTPEGVQSA
ncbi:MAG: ATP-binding protein [Planctomycetota bacterium]